MGECTRCHQLFPRSEFMRGTKQVTTCRSCWNERHREQRYRKLEDPEWAANYRLRTKAQNDRPEAQQRRRSQSILRRYGITVEDYEGRLVAQDNRCAICHQPLVQPQLDHDHRTKQLRGFLCLKCNGMLGMADDQIELLQSAIDYLLSYRLKK